MDITQRIKTAIAVKEAFPSFPEFAHVAMEFLGFPLTDMQYDIADYMQHGPRLRMVMAQRGEAKSTLAALYAVWRIIQDPCTKVLIVSGGETQAGEVAMLIVRFIQQWDILEYLRPDARMGDRVSVVEFDVHWALRGVDKSPSVACVGITSHLQGKRAHLLIPDDIETTKNGLTVSQREHLKLVSREFTSINTHGDILYLGTPQTKDSVYNALPARGFGVRIWPGRYPTSEEAERYGDKLAPYLADAIAKDPTLQTGGGLDGKRGKPSDPHRYDESALQEKELDQGPEGFQLQYMLDTSLADEARSQLKLSDFIVANFEPDMLPEMMVWTTQPQFRVELPKDFPSPLAKMWHPLIPANVVYAKPAGCTMAIDPAGGGADEIGYAIGCALGPYIHVFDVGGIRGGLTEANGFKLCDLLVEFQVEHIEVESNMGAGLFEMHLQAIIQKYVDWKDRPGYDQERVKDYERLKRVGVRGEYSTGQKERRIINDMVGALQRHKIVLHKRVFDSDGHWGKQHAPDKRPLYSLFSQIDNITTDRGSLEHDDRIEALSRLVRHFKGVLIQDERKASQDRAMAEALAFLNNPMGYKEPAIAVGARNTRAAILRRRY